MRECPVCQWKYDPEDWGWHEVPAHNFPRCAGSGTRSAIPTPCHATLEVYVKEIRNGVATVFVQSDQVVDYYPFTVPVEHLSGFEPIESEVSK